MAISTVRRYVRWLREDLGWSQEALALECRVHRTYVSQIERGSRNPTIVAIAKVAKGLKVPVATLLQEPAAKPRRLADFTSPVKEA